MDGVIKVAIVLPILYSLYKWLSLRQKRVKAYVNPGMFVGKPVLYCDIGNYFGTEPIIVNECHLIVDEQLSEIPVGEPSLSLPRTVQIREGIVFHFDPIPLVTKAREAGQDSFKVRALFEVGADKTYRSKPLTIYTDPKRFIRIFEDTSEHLSQPAKTALDIAHQIAEQLDQQLVDIPHIVLGLIHEQNGIGGYVLRKLGLGENFLLDLAKHSPNMPRDHKWPQTHRSMKTHDLVYEFMAGEARKMRQKCHGTGHLLLGLIRQKDEAFLIILRHLQIQPRQLRAFIYEVLLRDQHQTDHPTLPPMGIKRYVWASSYQVAHTLLIMFWKLMFWLFPDMEL